MWTCFMDMHSGGRQKLDYSHIYIELPEYLAVAYFKNRFGRNPHNVTCDCCGDDYSISEESSLEQASGYDRNCKYDKDGNYLEEVDDTYSYKKYRTIEEYEKDPNVLILRKEQLELGFNNEITTCY